MHPALIAIIVFIIAALVIGIVYGRSAKTALEPLPGETLLFHEAPVRVEQAGPVSSSVFTRCRVTVTDRRILIAQAGLFSRAYNMPRFAVTYRDGEAQADLGTSLRRGCLIFSIPKKDIAAQQTDEGMEITIPIPESALTVNQRVVFTTNLWEKYKVLH